MNKEDIYKYFNLEKELEILCENYIRKKFNINSTDYPFFRVTEVLYLDGGMLEIYYTMIGEKDSYRERVSIDTIVEI